MTYEEANSLNNNIRKDLNNTTYWLGSAQNGTTILYINSNGNINRNYSYGYSFGVRPVIVVSTSDIE